MLYADYFDAAFSLHEMPHATAPLLIRYAIATLFFAYFSAFTITPLSSLITLD